METIDRHNVIPASLIHNIPAYFLISNCDGKFFLTFFLKAQFRGGAHRLQMNIPCHALHSYNYYFAGLPERTVSHAAEIANMSLEILSSIGEFQVAHLPEYKLRIRMGCHTGEYHING